VNVACTVQHINFLGFWQMHNFLSVNPIANMQETHLSGLGALHDQRDNLEI